MDLIDTPNALKKFVSDLNSKQRVALDTEADSLHAYREKLCLIQIALEGSDQQELIDPLAKMDLSPFFKALKQKTIVLHGADYDLRLLRRAGNFAPTSVFDTLIAARLTGRKEFGYATLVKKEFGVSLTKASQKADWGKRPLTPTMLEYAKNDTRYLFKLAEMFEKELKALGRMDWFEQSCARAVVQASVEKSRDEDELWRIRGTGTLGGKSLAIVRELWKWRNEEASAADRPAFQIIKNEEILKCAEALVDEKQFPTMNQIRGPRLQRFQSCIANALKIPQSEWPSRKKSKGGNRPTVEQEKRADELKKIRDEVAVEVNLEASFIAPRAALEAIASNPESASKWLLPWQISLLKL